MSTQVAKPQPRVDDDAALDTDDTDAVWGAKNIGAEINRTAEQVRYLHKRGHLKGAVRKVGHRTYLGSRRKLRALPQQGF
jgi:hypothetical protein